MTYDNIKGHKKMVRVVVVVVEVAKNVLVSWQYHFWEDLPKKGPSYE